MMTQYTNKVTRDNPDFFRDTKFLTCSNSIDSLAPQSPIFPALKAAPKAPWMKYHNIVGVLSKKNQSFGNRISGEGDGIVAYESAHIDDVVSEKIVDADHMSVHRNPLSVLEVRRILNEHWDEAQPQLSQQMPLPRVQMARLIDQP
jgi:hypothetical protein